MSEPPNGLTWRRIAREPLLHFLLAGAAIFAIDAALRADERASVVHVDAAIESEVRQRLATRLGHAPSAEEVERAVDRWVETEILYREGVRRGFAEHDPSVRERVATRMAQVLLDGVVLPEPSDAELRAFFARDPQRFGRPARVDFTHVFFEGQEDADGRASEALALVRGGASPAGLGDRFSGGRRYRQRSLESLSSTFGASFVEGLADQEVGSWAQRRSRLGLHLVRVDARHGSASPSFEEVEADVRHAYERRAEEEALEAARRELTAGWDVVREP